MSRKKRFIEGLTEANIEELKQGRKHGKSYQFRDRCHCIILSYQGFEVKDLAVLFGVRERTIYAWFNLWEKEGILGLGNKPGRGRKPKLSINNKEQVEVVEKAARNAAEKGTNMLDEVEEKLDIKGGLSKTTLNRFLRKKSIVGKDYVISRKRSRL